MNISDVKILICDDSALARRQLKNLLNNIGCDNIIEATNGSAAVDMYKSNKPNIVFLDIVMPVKNGIDTIREIMEFDNNAYIVMASSVGTKSNLREALELGAKEFIQKPLNSDNVQNVLQSFLERGC